jgi:hypothetical protein
MAKRRKGRRHIFAIISQSSGPRGISPAPLDDLPLEAALVVTSNNKLPLCSDLEKHQAELPEFSLLKLARAQSTGQGGGEAYPDPHLGRNLLWPASPWDHKPQELGNHPKTLGFRKVGFIFLVSPTAL